MFELYPTLDPSSPSKPEKAKVKIRVTSLPRLPELTLVGAADDHARLKDPLGPCSPTTVHPRFPPSPYRATSCRDCQSRGIISFSSSAHGV